MKYRSDIDGLRALAVMAVVLYHVDRSLVPGGFAGVDIFFVISGFLITGIISEETQRGVFSFRTFYLRRIKRIVPALVVVTFVTLGLGHAILLPDDLERLAESASASVLFASNIYFGYALDTGYFAPNAATEPLLHLWSLGVEEQFYILWPLMLTLALPRLRFRSLIAILSALAIFSFYTAERAVSNDPKFAFFMLPPRMGELLIGGLCFYLATKQPMVMKSRVMRNALAITGMSAVLLSLAYLSHDSAFPGLNALPVTLGTALVILAGAHGPNHVSSSLS